MMPGTSARHRRDVLNLAAQFATQVKKKRDVLIELNQQTESLTKKDIATWRQAWQAAINSGACFYVAYSCRALRCQNNGLLG